MILKSADSCIGTALTAWLSPEAHLLSGFGHHVLALAANAAEARHLGAAGALVASQARRNGVRVLFSHIARACLIALAAATASFQIA